MRAAGLLLSCRLCAAPQPVPNPCACCARTCAPCLRWLQRVIMCVCAIATLPLRMRTRSQRNGWCAPLQRVNCQQCMCVSRQQTGRAVQIPRIGLEYAYVCIIRMRTSVTCGYTCILSGQIRQCVNKIGPGFRVASLPGVRIPCAQWCVVLAQCQWLADYATDDFIQLHYFVRGRGELKCDAAMLASGRDRGTRYKKSLWLILMGILFNVCYSGG
jgi:hypothetical protein